VNPTFRSTLPSPIRSTTTRKGSNITVENQRRKPMASLLRTHRGTWSEASRTEAYELNYSLSLMFLSKYRKQTAKFLRLHTRSGNHRNKRQKPPHRSNFCPKNMHFYGFLNKKLIKSNKKIKGRRIKRALPVTMNENWTWSEKLKVRKGFVFERTLGNFQSFWEMKW